MTGFSIESFIIGTELFFWAFFLRCGSFGLLYGLYAVEELKRTSNRFSRVYLTKEPVGARTN